MALVSLSTMRTRAIRAADAEGTLNPADVTDQAYTDPIINSALGRLHDLLTETFEDYHLSISGVTTVVSPATTFTLTSVSVSNLLKLRSMERQRVDGTYEDVPEISLSERNRQRTRGYFLASSTIYLYPGTEAPGTYRLWYAPPFTPLANDSATYDTINGWEELAVVDAAMQFKFDMDKDAGQLERRYAALVAHIKGAAKPRNASGPRKVRHVQRRLRDRLLAGRWEDLE